MPIRAQRALAATAAAVTAALLPAAAPPATAASATASPAAAAPAAAPGPHAGAGAGAGDAGGPLVTLLTGDRVRVDGAGRVTAVLPAPGRERIPVQALRAGDGHTLVIPQDATGLVLDGTVDRRLFDVTELSRPAFRALHGDALPFIVRYDEKSGNAGNAGNAPERDGRAAAGREQDGPAAGRRLRAAAGDAGVRPLRSIGADAAATAPGDTAAAWAALTRPSAGGGRRTAAPGVASVWLDGPVRVGLDRSVRQIGAPAAWEAGLDGEGVTIAVLDSGIDTTHPDLAGAKVAAAKNFSASPGTTDRYGHGTHVASIAAGTGAASGGAYRGVAPAARLLNAKVIGDDNSGSESGVIAGMEWAVARGADVVNLSIGAADAPGVGPMEEAVNRLSARSGALFVAAAGNAGPRPGSVGSPGSAEAALTVGAVDREDRLAGFSSVGPRAGDGGLKPDLTAPGVGIGAALAEGSVLAGEAGPVADGYGSLSGTSMAAPHAAGAAALLAERHPDWSGERIKAALTGSAAPGDGRSVFEEGAGRVDAGRAAGQTLVAGSSSLGFGAPRWPHADDEPVTRDLVHRNLGEEELTLTLSVEATGPDGEAAPEGMFALDAERVTVPAGGTVSTGLTADTRPGGDRYGEFEVAVTASGGGQSVRTVGAVTRERESYDLTVRTIGRDGAAPADWAVIVHDYERGGFTGATGTGGTATLRLPEGSYLLSHQIVLTGGDGDGGGDGDAAGLDWQLRPRLDLTGDTTLTFDARKAEPVEITVPDPEAEPADTAMSFDATVDGRTVGSVWLVRPPLPLGFRTRHAGPELPDGQLHAKTVGSFRSGPGTEYRVAYGREGGLFTGLRKDVAPEELAELTIHQGAAAAGRQGAVITEPHTGDLGGGWTVAHLRDVPGTFTQFLNTEGVRWSHRFEQMRGEEREAVYAGPRRAAYTAGERYEHTYNTGVFGPLIEGEDGGGEDGGGEDGLFRQGNTLTGRINPLADGAGHRGESLYDGASTTLYRNGEPYAATGDVLDRSAFTLPPEKADYRLVTTVARSGAAAVSRRVTSSWTFTSGAAGAGEERLRLPASAVRFTPRLAPDSTAPAGAVTEVPVTVQGSAAGDGAGTLAVHVSSDGGRTWEELPVRGGAVRVRNPDEPGTGVSLRAEVTGGDGHELTQTILDAYRTR
ncbi:S8 family serine peptidase [Streptomyces sp. F63]|uniref:S8 family serine peptidase n=1 Tax=Streptomyces sp. F63 TaxID=2824887 RepID=UPI0027DD3F49|nr:S8 family serine peptidase [Streptomyces sp. F63]